jgi:SHS2 domain-containing protein
VSSTGHGPPLQPGFEIVEHTADFAIAGQGRDLPELFAVMARGLFALICDVEAVQPQVIRAVSLEAAPLTDLLHGWLQEINGLHHAHLEVYSRFTVQVSAAGLQAEIGGEPNDGERHAIQHEVKGVTWHALALAEVPGGWRAQVLVDV